MWVTQLPSGRWRGGFRLPSGKKVHQSFAYQYEAEAWAVVAERRGKSAATLGTTGETPPPGSPGSPTSSAPTVRAHGRHWLTRRRGLLATSTVTWYSHQLTGIGTTSIAAARVDELRRSDVESWLTAQVQAGVTRPTINARLKVLRMILRDAHSEGLAERNAADGIAYLPTDIKAAVVLDHLEEHRLLAAAEDKPDLTAQILLALDAGLRWEEAAGVGVDCFLGEYLVIRQVVERDSRSIRAYPKGKRSRVVPMTERLMVALAPLRESARRERGTSALLFTSGEGRALDYWNWRRDHWRPARHEAGLKRGTRFHDLRHTYGSRLAAAAVPRHEIAELLGHADEATTARYIHAGVDGHRLTLVRQALATTA